MNERHWSQCPFVVVDVEGNGQVPAELVELAAVHIRDRKVLSAQSWDIRPSLPITEHALSIHGITNEQAVMFAPWSAVSGEILPVLTGAAMVGHNVCVDARLIWQAQPDWQPMALIDTLVLAKRIVPGEPSYALTALMKRLLPHQEDWQHHRAKGDALATAALFLALMALLEGQVDLTFLTLMQIGRAADDPYLPLQQRSLF